MKITKKDFNRELAKINKQAQSGFFKASDIKRKLKALEKKEVVKAIKFDTSEIKTVFKQNKSGNATKKIVVVDKNGNELSRKSTAKALKVSMQKLSIVEGILRKKKDVKESDFNDVFELLKKSREQVGSFNLHEFNDFFKNKKSGFYLNGEKISKNDLLSELLDYEASFFANSYMTLISYTQKGNKIFIEIDEEIDSEQVGFYTDESGNTFLFDSGSEKKKQK
jgi:hypothetical protein